MTTNAQLATQVANALTRWNAELGQLADWLGGSPTGGPNLDGRYPLTNAESETELFLCLPALIDTINGPAGQAGAALTAIQVIEASIAQDVTDAENEVDRAAGLRDATQILKDRAEVLRDEVAAYWAAVEAKSSQVASDTLTVTEARDDTLAAKQDVIEARDETQLIRDAAEVFDPGLYVTVSSKLQPDGVAGLDAAGKVYASQLPALVTVETFVEDDEFGHLTAPAEQGDVVVRRDLNKSFIHVGTSNGDMTDWQELLSPTSEVASVEGRVGSVTLGDVYSALGHSHVEYAKLSGPQSFDSSMEVDTYLNLRSRGGGTNFSVGSGGALNSSNLTGHSNVAFGYEALASLEGGSSNVAIGRDAMTGSVSSSFNVAIGRGSLWLNQGHSNSCLGYFAGRGSASSTFSVSVVIGTRSGYNLTTGNSNSFIGANSGYSVNTGHSNTLIGYNAGRDIVAGFNNTIVGSYVGTSNMSNTVALASGGVLRLTVDANGCEVNGDPVVTYVNPPSSSASAGTPGQQAVDQNYHYVCVGSNLWKRHLIDVW